MSSNFGFGQLGGGRGGGGKQELTRGGIESAGGYQKYFTLPTPLDLERGMGKMVPNKRWQARVGNKIFIDKLRELQGEVPGKPASPAKIDAWIWRQTQLDFENEQQTAMSTAQTEYINEFICWLQGKSRWNTKKLTPWGRHPLVGDTIKQYIGDFAMQKATYRLELERMRADPLPPPDIDTAWMYWKYIVSAFDPDLVEKDNSFQWDVRHVDQNFLPDFEYWIRTREDPRWAQEMKDRENLAIQNPDLQKAYDDGIPKGDPGLKCEYTDKEIEEWVQEYTFQTEVDKLEQVLDHQRIEEIRMIQETRRKQMTEIRRAELGNDMSPQDQVQLEQMKDQSKYEEKVYPILIRAKEKLFQEYLDNDENFYLHKLETNTRTPEEFEHEEDQIEKELKLYKSHLGSVVHFFDPESDVPMTSPLDKVYYFDLERFRSDLRSLESLHQGIGEWNRLVGLYKEVFPKGESVQEIKESMRAEWRNQKLEKQNWTGYVQSLNKREEGLFREIQLQIKEEEYQVEEQMERIDFWEAKDFPLLDLRVPVFAQLPILRERQRMLLVAQDRIQEKIDLVEDEEGGFPLLEIDLTRVKLEEIKNRRSLITKIKKLTEETYEQDPRMFLKPEILELDSDELQEHFEFVQWFFKTENEITNNLKDIFDESKPMNEESLRTPKQQAQEFGEIVQRIREQGLFTSEDQRNIMEEMKEFQKALDRNKREIEKLRKQISRMEEISTDDLLIEDLEGLRRRKLSDEQAVVLLQTKLAISNIQSIKKLKEIELERERYMLNNIDKLLEITGVTSREIVQMDLKTMEQFVDDSFKKEDLDQHRFQLQQDIEPLRGTIWIQEYNRILLEDKAYQTLKEKAVPNLGDQINILKHEENAFSRIQKDQEKSRKIASSISGYVPMNDLPPKLMKEEIDQRKREIEVEEREREQYDLMVNFLKTHEEIMTTLEFQEMEKQIKEKLEGKQEVTPYLLNMFEQIKQSMMGTIEIEEKEKFLKINNIKELFKTYDKIKQEERKILETKEKKDETEVKISDLRRLQLEYFNDLEAQWNKINEQLPMSSSASEEEYLKGGSILKDLELRMSLDIKKRKEALREFGAKGPLMEFQEKDYKNYEKTVNEMNNLMDELSKDENQQYLPYLSWFDSPPNNIETAKLRSEFIDHLEQIEELYSEIEYSPSMKQTFEKELKNLRMIGTNINKTPQNRIREQLQRIIEFHGKMDLNSKFYRKKAKAKQTTVQFRPLMMKTGKKKQPKRGGDDESLEQIREEKKSKK